MFEKKINDVQRYSAQIYLKTLQRNKQQFSGYYKVLRLSERSINCRINLKA